MIFEKEVQVVARIDEILRAIDRLENQLAILEGENFIKIFPREEFDITQLEILLRDR